jgi:hypothetical protein
MTDANQGKNLAAVLRNPTIARPLHLSAGNVLETRQQVERDRHPRPSQSGKQNQFLDMLQVLVLENEQQSFGLVVNQILDIVESTLEPQSPSTRAGVLHCCVISDRVTELLDVPAVLLGGEAFEPPEVPAGVELN